MQLGSETQIEMNCLQEVKVVTFTVNDAVSVFDIYRWKCKMHDNRAICIVRVWGTEVGRNDRESGEMIGCSRCVESESV